ncbi:FAD-dependent oxidoreductase [Alistipes sp. kh20]|uniref:FAD-dependent oxidoreductase n=1 Tax=Alistipes montrealensis TaxID=2834113 RepID=UPI001BCF1837|nr:FAD-dependent oxidoreductase [Alistipes montrealensis]MBS4765557.1 FAD-dependent oxidoreductase [Alistipes montrealensis]
MKRVVLLSVSLLLSVSASFGAGILVEAESFRDKGGWAVDQQFMDLMGSPYLIAHGMGKPVKDATTTVEFPEDGTYRAYVRTFNWVAPWYDGDGPGKFSLRVGNRKLPAVLGNTGTQWMWQCAGKVSVRKGPVNIALTDLSGFDGRCDAVYFTTEEGDIPPSGAAELAAFRKRMLGIPETPQAAESFDFVVVGGGIAGMCAAAAASRLGCTVALVNDRPVLGGNNSSEIRVHLGGVIELGPNKGLGRMIREFGHSRAGNAQPAENYEDAKKSAFIAAEENVTLFASCRAVAVNKDGGRIRSVVIRHIETGEETTLEAPLFADCTGDGTVGFLAGADYRMGRESRDEFGEALAPETADRMTMGSSVQWYSVDASRRTDFPRFSYGVEFNESNCERVTMGEWKWETGMNLDQVYDFERIRDYGLLVIYSNWSFLKNGLKDNAKYRNRELGWVAYVAGKRESRRLLGDYVLKQDDIDKNVFHEDASFTATWDIDLHFPDSVNSVHFPGREFKAATKHVHIYPHAVPYRCLYSRNVDNLFMAGRNISVTHVALGTVRVMRTTGMMGEVVGMAAFLCRKYGATPRQVYQKHLGELRTLMREGVGKKEDLPNNQKFNQGDRLKAPRALRND